MNSQKHSRRTRLLRKKQFQNTAENDLLLYGNKSIPFPDRVASLKKSRTKQPEYDLLGSSFERLSRTLDYAKPTAEDHHSSFVVRTKEGVWGFWSLFLDQDQESWEKAEEEASSLWLDYGDFGAGSEFSWNALYW